MTGVEQHETKLRRVVRWLQWQAQRMWEAATKRGSFRWRGASWVAMIGNSTAYLKVRIPHDSGAPGRFKGATARVRLNSTPQEIHTSPHTRRTRSLRPIPEAGPAFNSTAAARTSSPHSRT